jgi:hypothetical protein
MQITSYFNIYIVIVHAYEIKTTGKTTDLKLITEVETALK